jgi:hypothetical protein
LEEAPELALVDENGQVRETFTRLVDYGESVERHGGSGRVEAPITLIVFAAESAQRMGRRSAEDAYASFRGLDLRGRIVMFVGSNALHSFDTEALVRGAVGALIISSDIKPRNQVLSADCLEPPVFPVFRITPAAANTILARDGLDLDMIEEEMNALEQARQEWAAHDLTGRARMALQLHPPETVTLYNVMALLNGADAALADDLVIVSSHYDGWGRAPNGTLYTGANSNATGVATMLEIARLWQEQAFQPRRSVLFVAWAGGELPYSGAHYFRDTRASFINNFRISAVVHRDRWGSAAGDGLVVRSVGRRDTLYDLLVASAAGLKVNVTEGLALRHHYQRVFSGEYGDQLGGINGSLVITWGDPEPALDADTLDSLAPEHLSQAAQVINLTLITAAHEPRY